MKQKNKKPNYKKGSGNQKTKKGGFKAKSQEPKVFKKIQIKDINVNEIGNSGALLGIVDRVVQTPGPTVFYLSDGTGTLPLKAFAGPGERAYPEVIEGSPIRAEIKIEEFRGEIEGESSKISLLSEEEHKALLKSLEEIERERAKVPEIDFLAKSPILDKLKPEIIKAATEVRLAVIQNRPIIVRHHNDADGYSSGYALEKAILPLIEEQHGFGKSAWEFFSRAPCSAPFYEIDDSIRDTANSLRNVAKFSNKLPLIIIADNGSSEEDLFAIQQGKVHGIDFIVIDHHVFNEDVISKEVLAHINPFLVGESGEQYSAGMLCCEIARFINPEITNVASIAAMAGLADHIDNSEVIDTYTELAKDEGYTKDLLGKVAIVMDFVSTKLRFMEAREYISVIFGEPIPKQKALVELMHPYIKKLEEKGLAMATSSAKTENIGPVLLQTLMIDEALPGFGFYPRPGIAINLLHDNLKKESNTKAIITFGIMGTAITMRATDEANFSVHGLIDYLNKKLPGAFVEGGGHKNAGAINFVPKEKEPVIGEAKKYIKSQNK